jgi:hypothetical protein
VSEFAEVFDKFGFGFGIPHSFSHLRAQIRFLRKSERTNSILVIYAKIFLFRFMLPEKYLNAKYEMLTIMRYTNLVMLHLCVHRAMAQCWKLYSPFAYKFNGSLPCLDNSRDAQRL